MHTADPTLPGRGRLAAASLIVLALSGAFFYSFHDYGLAPFDEGVLLEGIRLAAEGRMDSTRFLHYSTQYDAFALLFGDDPIDLDTVRQCWVVVRALTALLIVLIAVRLMPIRWALLPMLLFVAAPGPWHKAPVAFGVCLCLHAMVRALERGRRRDGVWLGLCLALAFALHPYTGVLAGFAWGVLIIVDPSARFGGPASARTLSRFITWNGTVAVTTFAGALVLAPYLRHISPIEFFGQNAGLTRSILPGSRVFAAQLRGVFTDPELTLTVCTYLVVLAVLIGTIWIALIDKRGDLGPALRTALLVTAVVGGISLAKWVVRLDLAHMLQNAVPAWILLAFWLNRLTKGVPTSALTPARRLAARVAASLLGLWFVAMTAFGLASPDTFVGGIGTRIGTRTVPFPHPHGTLHLRPEVAHTLGELSEIARVHSSQGDTMLVRAYPKILHYLTDRPSPVIVPVFAFPAAFAANPVDELVAEIRGARTSVVIFDPNPIIPIEIYRLENLAPDLYRMIIDEYRIVAEVGSMEVRVATPATGK